MTKPRSRWHEKPFPLHWEMVLWAIFVAACVAFWVLRWMFR